MSMLRRSLVAFSALYAVALINSSAAWAGGAGPEMPWNAPLQNLLDNLSGPTAVTIGMLMFVIGALMWGLGRNEETIRKFGGTIFGVAIAVGVINLFNALGFQGAVM
jgi:type IV secretion system protein TrbC